MAIVVGLGITKILSDVASIFEHRSVVVLDGIPLLWAFNVLCQHLLYWWVVVGNWRNAETWSFAGFGALFAYAVALYFSASIILPRATESGVDLATRFEKVRKPFFSAALVITALELLDSFSKGLAYVLDELGNPYLIGMGLGSVLILVALRTTSRRFHWAFAIWAAVSGVGWVVTRFGSL